MKSNQSSSVIKITISRDFPGEIKVKKKLNLTSNLGITRYIYIVM